MLNLNVNDILETIHMISDEHLDIRTITMGISLLDCCRGDINASAELVYDKITMQRRCSGRRKAPASTLSAGTPPLCTRAFLPGTRR